VETSIVIVQERFELQEQITWMEALVLDCVPSHPQYSILKIPLPVATDVQTESQ
jgi:hypothetical protein